MGGEGGQHRSDFSDSVDWVHGSASRKGGPASLSASRPKTCAQGAWSGSDIELTALRAKARRAMAGHEHHRRCRPGIERLDRLAAPLDDGAVVHAALVGEFVRVQ